jgi:selenocysteine lyase/cysteine desulfurase
MSVAVDHGLDPGLVFRSASPQPRPYPLGAPRSLYFYRARNAIYHLFRALGYGPDDVVLVPDYHNTNEVMAIRAAGAAVRFYRIDAALRPDIGHLAHLCRTVRPRALWVIHYFGFPQPLRELLALCDQHGVQLMEDCALSLLSETEGRPLGSFGQYATFCLYKTLPVPDGGVLAGNGGALAALAPLQLRPCDVASLGGRTLELVLEWFRSRAERTGEAAFALKRAIGRGLRAARVPRVPFGDIGFDLGSVNVAISPLSRRLLGRFDYDAIRRRRRENYRLLRDRLRDRAALLTGDLEDGTCPMLFPLLVPDKPAGSRALRARGIAAMEFWNTGDPDARGPVHAGAQFLRDHLVELPIHQDVTASQVEDMADQVLALGLHFPRGSTPCAV